MKGSRIRRLLALLLVASMTSAALADPCYIINRTTDSSLTGSYNSGTGKYVGNCGYSFTCNSTGDNEGCFLCVRVETQEWDHYEEAWVPYPEVNAKCTSLPMVDCGSSSTSAFSVTFPSRGSLPAGNTFKIIITFKNYSGELEDSGDTCENCNAASYGGACVTIFGT